MKRKPQGFAAQPPARRREIARKGSEAAKESGKSHRWTSEEAVKAGRKGGEAMTRRMILNRSLALVAGELGKGNEMKNTKTAAKGRGPGRPKKEVTVEAVTKQKPRKAKAK
jgi:uncharacterized protein